MSETEMITSRSNAQIKLALSVRKSARTRRETQLFFLEGARLCADAAACGTVVSVCLFTDAARQKYAQQVEALRACAQTSLCVSEPLSDYLAETEHPQGVFCLCRMPETSAKLLPTGKYIALSFVQNPDNLGAVSRTAEALGLDGIVLEGGCDPYHPKAQRASMGSLLRLPVIRTEDLQSLLRQCREGGMQVYASTPDSAAESVTCVSFSGGAVCVVGNEGAGLREELLQSCTRVTIPMRGRAESLNAAAAASILMWEMMRGNGG